jgi:hypothetical protein
MDIDDLESYASANFHLKIYYIVACRKKTNNMSITRDTIHISLFFFAQIAHGYILKLNFIAAKDTTREISIIYLIFFKI